MEEAKVTVNPEGVLALARIGKYVTLG